ncbi:uncharacterized protein [Diadema setosum]|uniref:uncharacterized protein n=1 Tax=Diadema setosum TaxID=31175 RepID=UPI003B3A3BD5
MIDNAPPGRRILYTLNSINVVVGFERLDEIANKTSRSLILVDKESSPFLSLTHQTKQRLWYISPVKFTLSVECYEGLLVIESDKYVCYDEFTPEAAELVCEELGFPAAKEYTSQFILANRTAAIRDKTLVLSCGEGSLSTVDCLKTTTQCSSNRIVRLHCREPGFLGCYKGNHLNLQAASQVVLGVDSDGECMSTCRGQPQSNGVAVMQQGVCICFQSETYAQVISVGNFSHNWTCALATEVDSNRHHSFNLSVGFCDHPGIVPNGSWDSDITNFGSKITLSCDKGYAVNGSAALQCVRQPGWSTYFPVWNASVPSCQAVENHNSYEKNYNIITYILGTLLVVFAVVGILSIAWCRHQQKRRREASSQKLKVHSSEELSQLDPPNTSTHIEGTGDHRAATAHPENTYENRAAGRMSLDLSREPKMSSRRGVESSAETRSLLFHDVIHQDSEHFFECMNTGADNTKALYMDMSGSGKKGNKNIIFLQSRHISEEERDVDEDGYLLSNVSLHRVTRVKPQASRGTIELCEINRVSPSGNTVGTALSNQPTRAAGDTSQSGNVQSSIYHEIPSASDQSTPIPEPQYCPTYWNIEGNDEFGPYAMTQNDPLYAASIYPSTPRVEHEVDEHGYLVLEAHTDENINGRCESQNNFPSSKRDLYESDISPRREDDFNSTVYESIPREPEL